MPAFAAPSSAIPALSIDSPPTFCAPLRASEAPFETTLTGDEFSGAGLTQTQFSGPWMLAANLDAPLFVGVGLAGAELGAATFCGSVVLDAYFTDVGLKGTD